MIISYPLEGRHKNLTPVHLESIAAALAPDTISLQEDEIRIHWQREEVIPEIILMTGVMLGMVLTNNTISPDKPLIAGL